MNMNSRNSDMESSKDGEFEFYLKSGMAPSRVESILKSQGKDSREVDAFVDKYSESLKKIKKVIRKFVMKIEAKYGHLEVPDLVRKGLKFASKYDFNEAEKEAFMRFVVSGDVDKSYEPYADELHRTEMAKFLGFTAITGQAIEVKPTDQAALNEIYRLYEINRPLFSAIRNTVVLYKDLNDVQMTTGTTFDRNKHNLNSYIHPVVHALFSPKIWGIEHRMLLTNIGRMILNKTQHYFYGKSDLKIPRLIHTDAVKQEVLADFDLAFDIARDPNSLNYFGDETPMTNLLKRFTVQIELLKNVMMLRQGKYFSSSGNFMAEDNISGFMRAITAYDSVYFDSPDLYQTHDEATVLRRLLAVFSLRPTLVQLSTYINAAVVAGPGSGSLNPNLNTMGRATYLHIPVCTIKPIPSTTTGKNVEELLKGNSQVDWFIENKMLVPKARKIVRSNKLLFVHINRQRITPYGGSIENHTDYIAMQYLGYPTSILNTETGYNEDSIVINDTLKLENGDDNFTLRSFVAIPNKDPRTGDSHPVIRGSCMSVVIDKTTLNSYKYDPFAIGLIDPTGAPPEPVSPNGGINAVLPEYASKATLLIYSSSKEDDPYKSFEMDKKP